MAPGDRNPRVEADTRGVLRPAASQAVTTSVSRTVRNDLKLRERLHNPFTAECLDRLHRAAGMATPVITTPPPTPPPVPGPVLGYRASGG